MSHPVEKMKTAIVQNDLKTAKALVEDGFPLDELLFHENTIAPLHYAVDDRKVRLVRYFLEAGADPNLLSGHHGQTPLLIACGESNEKCLQALIEGGADVNQPGQYVTPVIGAIQSKRPLSLCKMLVDAGAKVQIHGNFGPLHVAASSGAEEVIDFLVEQGCGVNDWAGESTPLMDAIQQFDTVRIYPQLKGFSAFPKPSLVQRLLDHGADAEMVYRKNLSPEEGRDTTGSSIRAYAEEVKLPKRLLGMLDAGS